MTAEPYTTKQKPMRRLFTSLEFIHQFHMAASVVKSPYPGKALDGLRTLGNDQGASVTRRREKTALAWYVWSDHMRTSNSLQISKPCWTESRPKCLSCRVNAGTTFFPTRCHQLDLSRQRVLFQSTIFWEWCIDIF